MAVSASKVTPGERERPWREAFRPLRRMLRERVPAAEVRRLHRLRPARHFAVLARQLVLWGAGLWLAGSFTNPLLWVPGAVLCGLVVFDFTVLLHEVVHDAVFRRKNTRANRLLGLLYAFPVGISATQFTRWHLDHHDALGSATGDPKRHRLSPRRNARWLKLLYATPALFPIYFRAAARETATYPAPLRRTIARERAVTVAGHVLLLALVAGTLGWGVALRAYLVPWFLVFPVFFTINRLGQHYDIDPDDPAHWSTPVAPSPFWDRAFLWSNYHLEHHWYPRVPFYNLPRLHRLLRPVFREVGLRPRTYRELLWNWFVRNRPPHARW